MRSFLVLLLVLPTLGLAACGADGPEDSGTSGGPGATRAAARLDRQASAPVVSGALEQIADVAEARRRVGFVDPEALAGLLPEADAAAAIRRVLGPGAAVLEGGDPGAVRTAVQVGRVTVLGTADGKREVRGTGATAAALEDPTPERSVIQPVSPGSVQGCLGDTAAQTIVGPEVLGPSSAIGVGLRSNLDAPAGLKVVICVSPHYRKQIHGSVRAMERRFGRADERDPRAPVIGEDELGEQEIAMGVVPAETVSRADLLDLLEGGDALQSLVPPPPR